MEKIAIKLKYKDVATLNTFDGQSLLMKLKKTPTNQQAASHINHILKEIERMREEIMQTYLTDVREAYAKRSEDGSIDQSEAEATGQKDNKKFFVVDPAKKAEYEKALEAFNEREIFCGWRALSPSALKDIQVSAEEIGMLSDMYSEQEGPGIPALDFPVGPRRIK